VWHDGIYSYEVDIDRALKWAIVLKRILLRPVAKGTTGGSDPQNFFLCPPNFVVPSKICFKHIKKQKSSSPKNLFLPQTLKRQMDRTLLPLLLLWEVREKCLFFHLTADKRLIARAYERGAQRGATYPGLVGTGAPDDESMHAKFLCDQAQNEWSFLQLQRW